MSFQIPYHRKSFRPEIEALIPGNKTADNPVEFDLAPAWGPDKARMKCVLHGTLGLVQDTDWSPKTQMAVIAALEQGADAFVNTIEAVRGLTVPSIMALRAGLIAELPTQQVPGGMSPEDKPFPITTGAQFSKICGAIPALALNVALEVIRLSKAADEEADPRFIQPLSGSGATEIPAGKTGTAPAARRKRNRPGTAASPQGAGQ